MKKVFLAVVLMNFMLVACTTKENNQNIKDMSTTLTLTQEWDKVFPQSDKVDHKKVTFKNRYGIELAADMYTPKDATGKLAAIAVSGPFGAVKEQVSGLYAQTMAERGFLTIAFDPSYTGESAGEPRRTASPDINTEDFLAAVDFLSIQDNVDPEKIGIIGICGFGGMAVNAAALDPRIKATVASTMYDMSRQISNNYNDAEDSKEFRDKQRKALAEARTQIARTGDYGQQGGVPKPEDLPTAAPQFLKDYADFYSTPRGYHPRSGGSTVGWNLIGTQSFLNQPMLCYANEISNPVLLIHGGLAHSRYFSETAFQKMTGKTVEIPTQQEPGKNFSFVEGNKELYIVQGAVHTDLYDNRAGVIPFDKIEHFYRENLK
jgi:hypothetical protein